MEFILLFLGATILLMSYPWYSKLRGNALMIQWMKNIPDSIIMLLYMLTIPGLSTAMIHRKNIKKYFKD